FQRTPSSVDERFNRPTDPEWVKKLTPGWQRRRMDNFNVQVNVTALIKGIEGDKEEDVVDDGWTDIKRNLSVLTQELQEGEAAGEAGQMTELADLQKMNQIRGRVDSIVKDQGVAEALKPWYRLFCKR